MHKLENANSLLQDYIEQENQDKLEILPIRVEKSTKEVLEEITDNHPLIENRSALARNLLKISLEKLRSE